MEEVTVELEVEDTQVALQFLNESKLVKEVNRLSNALGVNIRYTDIPELIRTMATQGINIFSFSQRNRLENYFLSLMTTPQKVPLASLRSSSFARQAENAEAQSVDN